MRDQKFGIEIEITGLTRKRAAEAAAEYFGTTAQYDGSRYDAYSVTDSQYRKWSFVSDASIDPQIKRGRRIEDVSDSDYKVELVSPICTYEDITDIQELTRKLREAGAIANSSCGIHVHINAAPYDAQKLRNITNIMASKEDLIYKALQVTVSRERNYCRKVDDRFLEELNRRKPHSLEAVQRIWYNGRDGSHQHYHDSRYHCLNLHSVFQKGTVEFRLFNGTTHAGKIKSYIQLCLAISNQALSQKSASRQITASSNEKYTFRTWLLRLGLIGDEFKTARLHLLEHLEGSIAWKDPEQAERQRDRLRQQREQAQVRALSAQSAGNTASLHHVEPHGQDAVPPYAPLLSEGDTNEEQRAELELAETEEIDMDEQVFELSMSM